MTSDHVDGKDGSLVIRAFERLASAACAPDSSAETVIEAAAMGIALAELGLLDQAPGRERLVARARRVLLGAGALRAAAEDGDARDALDLALDQARRGLALLGGASITTLDGPPTHEPTPRDLDQLIRGELDGHAAADVALRLHRSGARHRYAAFLPEQVVETRVRLAADSAPGVRDPALGRLLGSVALASGSLEAYGFEGGVIAIYAEPSMPVALTSIDVPLVGRAIETSGYLEIRIEGSPASVTLVLADGLRWTLQIPAR